MRDFVEKCFVWERRDRRDRDGSALRVTLAISVEHFEFDLLNIESLESLRLVEAWRLDGRLELGALCLAENKPIIPPYEPRESILLDLAGFVLALAALASDRHTERDRFRALLNLAP